MSPIRAASSTSTRRCAAPCTRQIRTLYPVTYQIRTLYPVPCTLSDPYPVPYQARTKDKADGKKEKRTAHYEEGEGGQNDVPAQIQELLGDFLSTGNLTPSP